MTPNNLMLAHMSIGEIEELSRAQGGYSEDPELGIPEFTKLGQMIEDPELAKLLGIAFEGYFNAPDDEKEEIVHGMDDLADQTLGDESNYVNPQSLSSEYDSPDVQSIEALGQGDDTKLVILPTNLFEFLWDHVPEEYQQVNPNDGYPQFGLFEAVFGVIGGVVGFALGGPLGASIGASLASRAGAYGEDQSKPEHERRGFGEHLMGAAAYGLGAYGLGGAAQGALAAANAAPGLSAMGVSQTPWSAFGSGLMENATPLLLAGTAASEGAKLENERNQVNVNQQNQERAQENELRKEEAVKNYNQYLEAQRERDIQLQDQRIKEYNGQMNPIISQKSRAAYDDYLEKMKNLTPRGRTRSKFKEGGEIRSVGEARKSRYIEGDEPGQKDNVHTNSLAGSRIFDADTVANIGDGNSLAGAKRLMEWSETLPSAHTGEEDNQSVPVALSAGEFEMTPDKVRGLGKGSLQEGHRKIDSMVARIREYKKHKKGDIPLPTKHLAFYLRNSKKRSS